MTVDVDVSAVPTHPAAAIGYEALYALWKISNETSPRRNFGTGSNVSEDI